ncbi:hypothetical protein ACM66B_005378 [Microbotryomycetes sp. NB124-2]
MVPGIRTPRSATDVEIDDGNNGRTDSTTAALEQQHVNGGNNHPHPRQNNTSNRSRGNNKPRQQQQQQHQSSRRAKFNATLSNQSNQQLNAGATEFDPTQSTQTLANGPGPASRREKKNKVFVPPASAPVSQTLLDRLTAELTSGTHDCSICFNALSRTTAIHSCSTCSTPFHLSCIKEWAQRSVTETAERAQLLATRESNPDPDSLEGNWRCPSCQTKFRPRDVPKKYKCYCGRMQDPPHRPPATPHSCGKPCARARPDGCKHESCGLLCHPGPCPPCAVVLELPCHCGKSDVQARCSAVHGVKGALSTGLSKDELLSCGQQCGKPLACGLHECERQCHEGECGDCVRTRDKQCYCGRTTATEDCGHLRSDRIECSRPVEHDAGDKVESWIGEWECDNVCAAPYDCGHHTCDKPCHPHSAEPLPCPFSPDFVASCPCGATSLDQLLPTPRQTCQDPVPTCDQSCDKTLPCGHACTRKCHHGDCGTCHTRINVPCRCGAQKTERICGERQDDGSPLPEFTCTRVCKAVRNCGRHQCARVCCPLSYQEALTAKNKGKKRQPLDFALQLEDDPLGLHMCDRTCGRKLNCGVHTCELNDHKGPCPPCLRADFDDLSCHCGRTVVQPPIPCSYKIQCPWPCTRESACGHPSMPHACHEEDNCPPCAFLTTKICACGKRDVPNVRCAQDSRKVSCGQVCGRLLRCGAHRCRKMCHVVGECEQCDQTCLKPRSLCGHPCPLPCHAPSACKEDEPCPKLIQMSCPCGHLQQSTRCGACTARPEGNSGKKLVCSDACSINKRNLALADALGIEKDKREAKIKEVEYDAEMMSFYQANVAFCTQIEATLTDFVRGTKPPFDKPSYHFPVMKRPQRAFTHELAELFGLRSESLDEEPRRSVVVHRQSIAGIPSSTLAEAYANRRKPAAATLTFGSLRKTPERKPHNALFLEGVLGFDESMLKDILRPMMRGLVFAVSWTSDEDVLVTFDQTVPGTELETKLHSIQASLRMLIEETGFCALVELATIGEDGKVQRGSWTPVGASSSTNSHFTTIKSHAMTPASRSYNGGGAYSQPTAGGSSGRPVTSVNAFASLTNSSPPNGSTSTTQPHQPGSVVGPGLYRPPKAVVASVTGRDESLSVVARVQDEADVPESWDVDDEQQAQQ